MVQRQIEPMPLGREPHDPRPQEWRLRKVEGLQRVLRGEAQSRGFALRLGKVADVA